MSAYLRHRLTWLKWWLYVRWVTLVCWLSPF